MALMNSEISTSEYRLILALLKWNSDCTLRNALILTILVLQGNRNIEN